ncbi:hypothetical protein TVNIR_0813 [Thioalkalivibrio nitratireducens DSM 14787]|uniref:Outer membrane protein beta-barrel domain-containing protein n=1 Tax=Thioalkalivibrio nitratireducens (strain DSM 14787 / UNIQEM 213 / ALEN2) TaxID=1255043 RepID=L0DU07_THIND|nr:hypothetical protein [Thioalkalivibrio nitratireducens]AGA32503.1 hypothetical protein TVNIR_0813 [Thioalkalivibrio nitratireducens DSM 14787]
MNACHRTTRFALRLVLGVLPFVLASGAVHADSRSLYSLGYTPGADARTNLDAFTSADRLRPGFRNDVQQGSALNLEVRSTRLPSAAAPGLAERSLETSGGYRHRFGGSGFGYGVDLGLGMYAPTWDQPFDLEQGLGDRSSFMVTDFSTGPTYESGSLRSRVRVGVRYPLLGEGDAASPLYGHRGDSGRGAGYVSLDSRLRFSNQTEMSLSVFYDDYGLSSSSDDWLSDGLGFRGGAGSSQSVVGFEMGLNF